MEQKKKLIEVALPLEAINAESAYEKLPGIGAHPRGLHQWWARRPFVTARAVIWSSLVDDPSAHPELFPSESAQSEERKRLFGILSRLSDWRNSNDITLLDEAKAEIIRSVGDAPISLLDPFAGGGAIPFEAQRLGIEAHAHDLNPVAVMINKAMIEIPQRFENLRPANPQWRSSLGSTTGDAPKGIAGLAKDVQYYGEWINRKAIERIGHVYPKVKHPDGKETNAIAWIWARTAKCPNPACGCTIPLVGSYVLSKRKGHNSWIVPVKVGSHFEFKVENADKLPKLPDPKKGRGACFVCPACGQVTLDEYIKNEGLAGRIGSQMMAVVTEAGRGRIYLPADYEQTKAANVTRPTDYPDGAMPTNPRWFSPPAFGMMNYGDLYSDRQLTVLTELIRLIDEVQVLVEKDAIEAGMENDGVVLAQGGKGAKAYSQAIGVYLAFALDRITAFSVSVSRWSNTNEKIMNCYARQALPMVWDYPEANILSDCVGGFLPSVNYIVECINTLNSTSARSGFAAQVDAQSDCGMRNVIISTDPPYYDNVGYADLSDFYYVWLRAMLKDVFPDLFRTMLVPKADELVATPYRFEGNTKQAKQFFEDGMYQACCRMAEYARDDIPVTIYYAFKQSETETDENAKQQTASTGWETMLSAIIGAGFSITGTWPMRTEQSTRVLSNGTNALASSIVLVCRKRSEDARSVTRREFINALHREMRPALEKLQSANIAPVDLAQSAIGPGIGVFSRYKSVLEADGKPMSVRAALQIINQELDAFYNEQEGELDRESRFCVDLFNQYAFNTIKFGDADILARAKNTSVQALADRGVLQAAKGQVRLLTREEIPERVSATEECVWLLTQQLARAMEKGGVKECASIVMNLYGSNSENAKALAYRLYTICERKNWAQEGYAYNNLVVAWPDIQAMAADMAAATPIQLSLEDVLNSTQQ